MKKSIFIIFIVIVASFSSCKTKQLFSGSGERATSARHLVKLVEQVEPRFTTMNASSISINLDMGGKKMNVSASLKIKTDSVVLLSIVPFMGIEMFSLELYPDRWILFDKINRTYYTDNYEYLYYKLGIDVDFTAFQSLFSARLFNVGEKEVDAKKIRFSPMEPDKNKLEFESRSMKQITTTYSNHVIEQVTLSNKTETHALTTIYKDYDLTRGVNYPRNIVIGLQGEDIPGMSLNMKIQKVTFNSELKLSLSNPERYTRGTLDQLIK